MIPDCRRSVAGRRLQHEKATQGGHHLKHGGSISAAIAEHGRRRERHFDCDVGDGLRDTPWPGMHTSWLEVCETTMVFRDLTATS